MSTSRPGVSITTSVMNVIVNSMELRSATEEIPVGSSLYKVEMGPGSVGVASQSGQMVFDEAEPPSVVITAVWQTWELQLWVVVVVVPVRSQPVLVAVHVTEQLSDPLTVEHLSRQNVAV